MLGAEAGLPYGSGASTIARGVEPPGTVAGLLGEMRAALGTVATAWDEGQRKEMGNRARKMTRQEAEHHSGQQQQWHDNG